MTDEEVKRYWIIITESGASWIGIPVAPSSGYAGSSKGPCEYIETNLRPAYIMRVSEVRDSQGRHVGFARAVWPIEMVCAHQSTPLDMATPVACARQAVAELDEPARNEIRRMIEGAEAMRRATGAGLVLAGG